MKNFFLLLTITATIFLLGCVSNQKVVDKPKPIVENPKLPEGVGPWTIFFQKNIPAKDRKRVVFMNEKEIRLDGQFLGRNLTVSEEGTVTLIDSVFTVLNIPAFTKGNLSLKETSSLPGVVNIDLKKPGVVYNMKFIYLNDTTYLLNNNEVKILFKNKIYVTKAKTEGQCRLLCNFNYNKVEVEAIEIQKE